MIETSPPSRRRSIRSRIIAPSLTPIAASGSSSSRMRASECTERAIAIAWRWPPDSRATGVLTDGMLTPMSEMYSSAARAHRAVVEQPQRDGCSSSRLRNTLWKTLSSSTSARSWKTVSMPSAARLVDRAQLDRLAVEVDLPRVGLVVAAEDLDQRRLAGAVVAQQAEHLALVERQVDVAQRGHRAEALGHALDAQDLLRLAGTVVTLPLRRAGAGGRRRSPASSRRGSPRPGSGRT